MTEDEMIKRGVNWYTTHQRHVASLMYGSEDESVKPDGEDAARPALWKPMHWRWFFETRQLRHDAANRRQHTPD